MLVSLHRFHPRQGWQPALPTTAGSASTLGVVLAAPCWRDEPVWSALPPLIGEGAVLGASTAGEIHCDGVGDGELLLALLHFEHTRLQRVERRLSSATDAHLTGLQLASALADDDLRAVLLLCGGQQINAARLVEGLTAGLGPEVLLTGGLAGDGLRFAAPWVLAQGPDGRISPSSDLVTAVGLYGPRLQVAAASEGGWLDFGPERQITRSEGTVLLQLDGRPALDLYRDYLGDLASGLPANALLFPLSITPPGGGAAVVRTILGIDEDRQSLSFAGDVPEGWRARLMRTSGDRLVEAAGSAAQQACAALPGQLPDSPCHTLALSVSCVGRRLVLGDRAEEEAEAICQALPPGTAHLGFFSYGEIGPPGRGQPGPSVLHNQTLTLTVLYEA